MNDVDDRPNNGSILLVGDTPSDMRLLGKFLSNQGFSVHAVTSGALALQAAAKDRP